jgi:hypothetical protein
MKKENQEKIMLFLKRIIIIEIILIAFPFFFFLFSTIIGINLPDLFFIMQVTISTPFVLMILGGLMLFVWSGPSEEFYKYAIGFLCFDFNKKRDNTYNKYWILSYFIFCGLYFLIFSIFFYFAGFKNIGTVIFLSWFGVIFLRLLHFHPRSYNTCRQFGKLLFTTFIPFGVLLEIGLIFFKDITILWGEMIVYIFFSIMMLLSTLAAEILMVAFKELVKGIRKK